MGAGQTITADLSAEAEREIVLTRVFDAPRERVFDAFTGAEHLSRWWGPRGFTLTTREMDVRPGGVWRFVMHGPDATDHPIRIVYTEVARPERLAYDHGDDDGTGSVIFRAAATFADEGGRTRLTFRMIFPTAAAREEAARLGVAEGGDETFERLDEYLARH